MAPSAFAHQYGTLGRACVSFRARRLYLVRACVSCLACRAYTRVGVAELGEAVGLALASWCSSGVRVCTSLA